PILSKKARRPPVSVGGAGSRITGSFGDREVSQIERSPGRGVIHLSAEVSDLVAHHPRVRGPFDRKTPCLFGEVSVEFDLACGALILGAPRIGGGRDQLVVLRGRARRVLGRPD